MFSLSFHIFHFPLVTSSPHYHISLTTLKGGGLPWVTLVTILVREMTHILVTKSPQPHVGHGILSPVTEIVHHACAVTQTRRFTLKHVLLRKNGEKYFQHEKIKVKTSYNSINRFTLSMSWSFKAARYPYGKVINVSGSTTRLLKTN